MKGQHTTDTSLPISTIQLRLGEFFGGFRKQIVVPNVSWGLLNHECDLVICSKSGYLTEVEIKRSYSDFLADFRKNHRHDDDNRIKYFHYAVPEKIKDKVLAYLKKMQTETPSFIIPSVLYYTEKGEIQHLEGSGDAGDWSRRRVTAPLSNAEKAHLAHLGCMRLFDTTAKLNTLQEKYKRATARLSEGKTDTRVIKDMIQNTKEEIRKTTWQMFASKYEDRHNPDISPEKKEQLKEEYDRLDWKKHGQEKYLEALETILQTIENK